MQKEYITESARETEKLGEALAKEIKGGEIISLVGDLGGGKTTFTKGFAAGLGIKKNITSPTFLVMREYPVRHKKISKLYHFDAYRIKNAEEFLDLGFNEFLKEKQAVILIEWADKVRRILPKKSVIIEFSFIDDQKRRVVFRY